MEGLLTLDNIIEGRRYTFHLLNGHPDITGVYTGIFNAGNPEHKLHVYFPLRGKAIKVHNEALGSNYIIYFSDISYITQPHAGGRRRSIRRHRSRRSRRRSCRTPRF